MSTRPTTTRDAVAQLVALGLAVCKPDPVEKKPTYPRWGCRSLAAADFAAGDQVGVIGGPLSDCGRPGHALVIVDLDAPEAVARADGHLPPTPLEDGRPGKPRSHRYYLVPVATVPPWGQSAAEQAAAAARERCGHPGPFLKHFRSRETGAGVLDFIGTGGQVVCPPSAHPSGERRAWSGGAPVPPAVVPFPELWRAACELASACGAEVPDVVPRQPVLRVPAAVRADVTSRAAKYLARMPAAVAGQNGHGALFTAARAMAYGFDLGADEAFQLLRSDYNPRCQPAWSDRELRHKAEDADRVPFDKPRGHLRDAQMPDRNGTYAATPHPQTGSPAVPAQAPPRVPPAPVPAYAPFPVAALPPVLRAFVEEVAGSVGCDPAFAALPALTLTGAAAGAAVVVSPKRKYAEPPCLWACTVGDSGTGKSPGMRPVEGMAYAIDRRMKDEHAAAFRQYQADLESWSASGAGPDRKPAKPGREYFAVSDATIERLCEMLGGSPRGLVLVRDELDGWFGSLTRYKTKGGSDVPSWLSIFEAGPIRVNRRTGEPRDVEADRGFVAVCGGIQPDVLRAALADPTRVASGFAARILFAYPRRRAPGGRTRS